jgi:HPt (histidine-containing phosphotransfer) domain-containing protein
MSPSPSSAQVFTYFDPALALENVGDALALREMLLMLQDVLGRDVLQISEFMEVADFSAAHQLLHSLKGCMPIFCTPALCQELTDVELLSKSPGREASASAYLALRPKLETLQEELGLHLAKPVG